ncbi:MAG: hypothetical protein WC373_04940 [Smithella sp.]|jgi:hypothetical protein
MTAATKDVPLDRKLGEQNALPVKASTKIYEGAMVGISAGYARGLVAGDPFHGHAIRQADNSASTTDGAININVLSGIYELQVTLVSVAVADVGKAVYASDDSTYTLTKGQNTRVGRIVSYVTTNTCIVEMRTLGADNGVVDASPLIGKSHHGIDSVSATQCYPLGTRMVKPDGREYRYGKAGATIGGNLGAHAHDDQHITHTTVAADAAVGDLEVVVDVASPMGSSADGSVALDELAGGYLLVFVDGSGADQKCFVRGIVSNTAVAAGSHEMTITVDDPIPAALVEDTAYAEAIASPFRNLQQTVATGKAVVGIPAIKATVGQYLWVQTKGPVWASPQAALGVTVAMEAVFRHDGSFDAHEYNDEYATTAQHAGYCLGSSLGAQSAPFVNLNI